MENQQRRHVDRVRIGCEARLAESSVHLADISIEGARLESTRRLPPGAQSTLSFRWRGSDTSVEARVVRCRLDRFDGGKQIFDVGVAFSEPSQSSIARLIAAEVSERLRQQKANAAGVLAEDGRSFGAQLARQSTPPVTKYLKLAFDGAVWRKTVVTSAEQPENGFTVSAAEGQDQIELLKRTFQRGDDAIKSMIRRVASMTISVAAAADARISTAA